MMRAIVYVYEKAQNLTQSGVPVSAMADKMLFKNLVKIKYEVPNDKPEMFGTYMENTDEICAELLNEYKQT